MIKLKIDLTKLTGAKRMKSNSGRDIIVIDLENSRTFQGKNGAVYADLCLIERKEPGEYGDTHFISEDVSKGERENGVKGVIVGNGRDLGSKQQSRPVQRQAQRRETMDDVFTGDQDDIAF